MSVVPKDWQRLPCTSCRRSYKFYCPKCNIPLGVPKNVTVPSLVLPLRVHVWFQDKIKKSTAPHAKVLAPQDVEIIPYPPASDTVLPRYTRDNAVIVYPSFKAITMDEINVDELRDIRTLIFIDCPWQKAPVIMTHPAIANLRYVKLARPPKESKFWRYHNAGAGCVSTIEAIQMMLEEYTAAMKKARTSLPERYEAARLPDLLFFFKLQFTRIVEHLENEAYPGRKLPMDADEKERRRLLYNQKEKGKQRRLENKQQAWTARSNAIQSGEGLPLKRHHLRCFNCKKDDHYSKDCPHPCRYCKQIGHFSAKCIMKKAAYEREMKSQQTPRTKAL
ncbi:hypothetical protein PsorP6_000254 [Peronosclerospora sorghi]|uniref:Uncharacterized protein n=1 Tax=Peronosclerospora sorghi TaxID=230839 RepID=A0ACC0WWX8_9STRA|nr:hypothetical protein PsorP6_000254 [Peronosclerospora sorghi]